MNWLVARLREPSTWRGIVWLATALGVSLKPEVWEQVAAVGMAVAGLIGVIARENQAPAGTRLPPIELVGKSGGARGRDGGMGAGAGRDERLRDVPSLASDPPAAGECKTDGPGWNG